MRWKPAQIRRKDWRTVAGGRCVVGTVLVAPRESKCATHQPPVKEDESPTSPRAPDDRAPQAGIRAARARARNRVRTRRRGAGSARGWDSIGQEPGPVID